MLLIRPLTFADLQGLERLAIISGGSMTTLPANRDHLSELISKTQRSLKKDLERYGDESYHFALEDTELGEIVGVCGIDASVGLISLFTATGLMKLSTPLAKCRFTTVFRRCTYVRITPVRRACVHSF